MLKCWNLCYNKVNCNPAAINAKSSFLQKHIYCCGSVEKIIFRNIVDNYYHLNT